MKYIPRAVQQSGVLKCFTLCLLADNIELSTSYLKHRERKSPGIMISPKPKMLNSTSPTKFLQGNWSFRGRSIPLATVTMTSDLQTQYMSYAKRDQRIGTATLKVLTPAYLMAVMVKKSAKRLLRSQYLETTYRRENRRARRGQKIYIDIFSNRLRIWSLTSHLSFIQMSSSRERRLSLDPPQQVQRIMKAKSRTFLTVS